MGIYVFKKDLMLKLLREQGKSNDFGGEIIPSAAASSRVMAYLFNGYWEDIGTIKSFFEANLGLAQQVHTKLLRSPISETCKAAILSKVYTRSRILRCLDLTSNSSQA